MRHVFTDHCCPPYVRAAGSVNTIGPHLISLPASRAYSPSPSHHNLGWVGPWTPDCARMGSGTICAQRPAGRPTDGSCSLCYRSQGAAWSILDCARRTSTFLSCAFREQEDDQATPYCTRLDTMPAPP